MGVTVRVTVTIQVNEMQPFRVSVEPDEEFLYLKCITSGKILLQAEQVARM